MQDLALDKTGQSSNLAGRSAAEVDVDPKMAKCCQMTSCLLVAELGKICWWFVPLLNYVTDILIWVSIPQRTSKKWQESVQFYWGCAFTLSLNSIEVLHLRCCGEDVWQCFKNMRNILPPLLGCALSLNCFSFKSTEFQETREQQCY